MERRAFLKDVTTGVTGLAALTGLETGLLHRALADTLERGDGPNGTVLQPYRFRPANAYVPISLTRSHPGIFSPNGSKDFTDARIVKVPGSDAVGLLKPAGKGLATKQETSDKFYIFQIGKRNGDFSVLTPLEVVPTLKSDNKQKDVRLNVSLESFHVGNDEHVKADSRATLKVIIGKDKDSEDKRWDLAYWAIASGMHLAGLDNKGIQPKDLNSDFKQALNNRPIEVPGGLANITFEVYKHRTKTFWERLFGFLQSGAGTALTAALGFPALTQGAVSFLGDLVNNVSNLDAKPLFATGSLKIALSQDAKEHYEGSTGGQVVMGALNPGFWVMARMQDAQAIVSAKPLYNATDGVLTPTSGNQDAFGNITYAVMRVEMGLADLTPNLSINPTGT